MVTIGPIAMARRSRDCVRATKGGEVFRDRRDAGRQLGERLAHLKAPDVVVLGLPRGGVPVAYEVAKALGAPLDVIVVRKLGVPFQPELAMGAIGEDGVRVLNHEVLRLSQVSDDERDAVEARERDILEQRVKRFRHNRPRVTLKDRTAVLVDDGIATGSTARAACQVAWALGARKVVVATPIASPSAIIELTEVADEVVSLETPTQFYAVGQGYADFAQTADDEVVTLLNRAEVEEAEPAASTVEDPPIRDEEVAVSVGLTVLRGHLTVPEHPTGIVVFVHGSGSSRLSPRNRQVANTLNEAGIGTLLFDLLTVDEEHDRSNVFDIDLLSDRLISVTRWLEDQDETRHVPIGYFGASTGAAAALVAASRIGTGISAVVSRGGRPDLAHEQLGSVHAPTLLIVGGRDDTVLDLNREAQEQMHCHTALTIVPGATHLFEEPGALDVVADEAKAWFLEHLGPRAS